MKDIIIDTDPGHDDALAIMLAVKSKKFTIQAITTVAGNSTLENATRNARYILKLLNQEEIPVYSGAEQPLERELVQAVVHGRSGLEGIDPTNPANLTGDAVDRILMLVDSQPDTISLIALGPLTNIAKAIQKNPEVMKKVAEILIMGGAVRVPGNKSRAAEFNMFVDPEAADIVFQLPVKKTLVPLDACNQVKLQMEDFEKITNPVLREPILSMMKPYIENTYKDEGVKAALMYDPLTVYYLINPTACEVREYDILVETKEEITRGKTIAELQIGSEKQNSVSVVEHISEEDFKKDFIAYLNT